jgi:hypothetical protein
MPLIVEIAKALAGLVTRGLWIGIAGVGRQCTVIAESCQRPVVKPTILVGQYVGKLPMLRRDCIQRCDTQIQSQRLGALLQCPAFFDGVNLSGNRNRDGSARACALQRQEPGKQALAAARRCNQELQRAGVDTEAVHRRAGGRIDKLAAQSLQPL